MKSFSLSIGSAIRLNSDTYKITDILNQKTLELTNLLNHEIRYVDNTAFMISYNNGEVEFLDDNEIDLFKRSQDPIEIDFSSFSEAEKSCALNKIAYIEAAEELILQRLSDKDKHLIIMDVAHKISDTKPPKSWATIQRWRKTYEESGRNIISLIGNTRHRGNRKKRFNELTENLVQTALNFYLTKERPSIQSAHKRLRFLEWENHQSTGIKTQLPSYDAFRKRVNALDKHLVMSKRYSQRIADMRFKAYKKGYEATRPLEWVEIDHTPLDLMVVDEESRLPLGRPTLTSMIDKFSRMVIGFYLSFTPPSTLSVIECLRHAILPKAGLRNLYPSINSDWPAHGIPETIVVDNGKEFLSKDFTEITRSLGINIVRSPVKNPVYKGAVERHFRVVAQDLLKDKPGKTFSNIFDKDEYDPKKTAVISLGSVVEITHLWVVDQLNDSNNSSINTTPRRMWESAIMWNPVRLPKNVNVFNVALGRMLTRKIQHYGIDFESLRYNSEELSMIRREHSGEVKIKYNPNDISFIYVMVPRTQQFIVVPCNDLPYAKKTLYQHQLIKKFARRQNLKIDITNFMRAEKRILEIIENEKILTKKIRRSSKQARYRDVSQKTQHAQNLSGQENKPLQLDNISLLDDDGFDPYQTDIGSRPKKLPANLLEADDLEMDELYADNPDWHADYSRKEDDK